LLLGDDVVDVPVRADLLPRAEVEHRRWVGEVPSPAVRNRDQRAAQLGGSVDDGQRMWITTPGVSDGDCGIAPGTAPGQFVPELAHRLITGT
jgi:hypothetical protein